MSTPLAGKTALVTGATGAIGSRIVFGLADIGAQVVALSDPDAERIDALKDDLSKKGLEVRHVVADVSQYDQVALAVDRIASELGTVDLLVNNAGVFRAIGALWEQDPGVWNHEIQVNLLGVFNCSRACIPLMLESGFGTIVNVTGGGFDRPNPGGSGYASSKAAVVRLTDTLAAELAAVAAPIAVQCVMPGLVRSRMTERLASTPEGIQWLPHVAAELDAGEDASPERVAEAVINVCRRAHDLPGGRVFHWDDNVDAIVGQADEIAQHDLFQIRWRREAPSTTPRRGQAL